MFLQKDLFDADGDHAPFARPSSSAGNRHTSAGSPAAAGGEDGEDVATPGSVVNMRAKMMQQRERLLAKQRSATAGSGSMVMANQGMPSVEVATPSGKPASPTGFSGTSPAIPGLQQSSGNLLGHSVSGLTDSGLDEDTARGAVVPAAPLATKEEEEARRKALQQELNSRGITPEYDPSSGAVFEQKSDFDIGSVRPTEMRGFLHNPVPEHHGTIQCRIVRERGGIATKLHPKYLMESDSGIFLMSAQKQVKNKTSNYAISMSKSNVGKECEGFLGKLRSDFLGIEWVAYGPGLNPSMTDTKLPSAQAIQVVREELLAVQYTASKWGPSAKGPRKMSVVVPHVQPNGERIVCRTLSPQTEGLIALQKSMNTGSHPLIDSYTNKPPVWNDTIGAYVLNFNKRVTEASVKNFQLVSTNDPKTVYLQFGRVGKEAFNLDFRHPLSPFQAFSMCLSSFDYKLGCE